MDATTIASFGIFCHAGRYCGSQESQLGRNVGHFSPLDTCSVASLTVKVSPQRGGFRSDTASRDPLSAASEVHGAFTSRDLPPASGR